MGSGLANRIIDWITNGRAKAACIFGYKFEYASVRTLDTYLEAKWRILNSTIDISLPNTTGLCMGRSILLTFDLDLLCWDV
jgi:hypothetical protein